jgi:ABC-type oligopeptide transport system substrate-binding subunit
VPTLDPALASDPTSISVTSLIYGGLVRLDSHLRVQPDGAANWTISRDGKVYTFHLRRNLRFADGSPVTAGDFVAAIDRALGPEGPAGTAPFYLQLIAGSSSPGKPSGVTAPGPHTVRITLVRPAAHFLSELAFPAGYVPLPSLQAHYGTSWTDHALGFGPYMVQTWRHSRDLVLIRNPYFYGGRVGAPRITIQFLSMQRALAAYRRGSIDVVSGLPAGQTVLPHVADLQRVPALALDYLAFNTARLPFHHLNARRAFASAIGPHVAVRSMGSSVFPSTSLVPSALNLPLDPWTAQASAAAYLKRAGYPGGRKFPDVVLVTTQDPQLAGLSRALKLAWMHTLGIDVRIQPLNASNYTQVLNQHAFDLALVRWGGDYPDPQDFLGTQLGSSTDNVTGWSKRSYNAAVALADSYSPLDPRRIQLLRQAASIATRSLPIVPLDQPAVTAIIRPGVSDLVLTSLGTLALRYPVARTAR